MSINVLLFFCSLDWHCAEHRDIFQTLHVYPFPKSSPKSRWIRWNPTWGYQLVCHEIWSHYSHYLVMIHIGGIEWDLESIQFPIQDLTYLALPASTYMVLDISRRDALNSQEIGHIMHIQKCRSCLPYATAPVYNREEYRIKSCFTLWVGDISCTFCNIWSHISPNTTSICIFHCCLHGIGNV